MRRLLAAAPALLKAVPPALVPALLLAGLAACSGDGPVTTPVHQPTHPSAHGSAHQPPHRPPHATGSSASARTPYDDYVALGDSYTAAPLVPPTDTSTICLRSRGNYPALVARGLPGTRLTDVSCSGARTENTVEPERGRDSTVPPQFRALTRGTDLVTIGLGGNDRGLFGTLLVRCTQLASADPGGAPCEHELGGIDALADVFAAIRHNVAGVVRGVRERSPHARIVVVGYPQIVPGSGTCELLPLAAGDYPFARTANLRLAEAVRGGAADAGAGYLDLWGASAGHDICADEPWINGRVTSADRALAYHPLAVEQRAVADLLLARLR